MDGSKIKEFGEKRVISMGTEEELIKLVINFAKKNGLTVTNINECMEKVKEYMDDNAILEKDLE